MPNLTIEQIKAALAEVKSGTDFPSYIEELKQLGVTADQHFLSDWHIIHQENNGYSISADPKWENKEIAKIINPKALKQY